MEYEASKAHDGVDANARSIFDSDGLGHDGDTLNAYNCLLS